MKAAVKTGYKVNTTKRLEALKQKEMSWEPEFCTSEFYHNISNSIRVLSQHAISEPYLLRDWVWINAQFRIAHTSDEDVARTSWASLSSFISLVQQLEGGNQDMLVEICWLTDRTVELLLGKLGSQAINKFISPEEQRRIDDLIIEFAESDKDDLVQLNTFAKKVSSEFSAIHHAAYFPSIANKLLALSQVAHESSEMGYWAKAALRYVCIEEDVINDNQGYVGFLDDIHVVENMYSFVFGELPWKRLIEQAAEQWPFITRAYWLDEDSKNHLTPLLKVVISCCLNSSLEQNQSRTIILPEVGPCGFLAAATFVLKVEESEKKRTTPEPGSYASFRDGHLPRYVLMELPFEQPDGSELPMVRLRDGGKRSIPQEKAILLEPVDGIAIPLATSKQLDRWLSIIEEDSQTAVHKFHRAELQTSVIFVTCRSDFFSYLETIRPYGRRLDELVSVEYRSRVNSSTLGSGAMNAEPTLIVCSSLDVAESLLREEGKHTKPQHMIIDRAVDHIALKALKVRCKQYNPKMKILVLSQVNTQVGYYPKSHEESIWLIRPDDVDPIPKALDPISVSIKGKGPLAKYVKRQSRATNVKSTTHIVEFGELENFYQAIQKVKQRALEEDSSLLPFAINSETALKYISTHPPVGNSIADERLTLVLTSLSQHAAAMGMYDQDLKNLASTSNELIKAIRIKNPKAQILFDLIKNYKRCHIVVASRTIADSLSKTSFNLKHVNVKFISVHDLESLESIESILIPGWLGRKEMLKLKLGGWSNIQLNMLYSFEHDRSSKQAKKLESTFTYLDKKTRESWKAFSIKNPEAGNPPADSQKILNSRDDKDVCELENEYLERDDWVESAVRTHINSSSINQSSQTRVLGRLIFFKDGQHYGVFAENAKLVCLNEVLGGSVNDSNFSESEADKLLWKSTKFLEIGDVLAFPDTQTLGDVIDELADAILGDKGAMREQSGLWRNALRKIYEASAWDLKKMQRKLSQHGVDRTRATLESWLFSTKTVAPQNPSQTIPNILACAGIDDSHDLAKKILRHVNRVYAARRKAGHHLVAQLSTASISGLGDNAFIEINGKEIRYRVLSISSVDEAARYDASILGVHSIHDGLLEVKQ
ncbi:DrmE family protein [Aliikangiella coralliicola]|uniref:Uncharacterized protein n=1 Tax=Aliikangiella coralliicola TaxID=2592383 RepID=A0A545UDX7_9GAMM|nr:DrmE family protein [Aliikangiella coralliicola]TQV87666.1 hypothetical protein FLL46_09775 [Aliikangiella coralliicola]